MGPMVRGILLVPGPRLVAEPGRVFALPASIPAQLWVAFGPSLLRYSRSLDALLSAPKPPPPTSIAPAVLGGIGVIAALKLGCATDGPSHTPSGRLPEL